MLLQITTAVHRICKMKYSAFQKNVNSLDLSIQTQFSKTWFDLESLNFQAKLLNVSSVFWPSYSSLGEAMCTGNGFCCGTPWWWRTPGPWSSTGCGSTPWAWSCVFLKLKHIPKNCPRFCSNPSQGLRVRWCCCWTPSRFWGPSRGPRPWRPLTGTSKNHISLHNFIIF